MSTFDPTTPALTWHQKRAAVNCAAVVTDEAAGHLAALQSVSLATADRASALLARPSSRVLCRHCGGVIVEDAEPWAIVANDGTAPWYHEEKDGEADRAYCPGPIETRDPLSAEGLCVAEPFSLLSRVNAQIATRVMTSPLEDALWHASYWAHRSEELRGDIQPGIAAWAAKIAECYEERVRELREADCSAQLLADSPYLRRHPEMLHEAIR